MIAIAVVATLVAVRSVRARGGAAQEARGSVAWLAAVGAAFVGATAYLWKNPEEAFHFVQYGGLAVFVHRALAHRLRDASIYVVGVLVGGLVGCVDETIQWVTPGRYWGARDIVINLFASTLAQVGIARGIAPPYVAAGFGRPGLVVALRVVLVWIAVLFFFAFNTPQRLVRLVDGLPLVGFLADNESTMTEYGHRFEEAEIGVFRSRLSADALRAEDERRAESAAEVLDRYPEDHEYYAFLKEFPAQRDAFLHEMRVHLFRRDRYALYAANQRGQDEAEYRKLATVAVRENRILERYFGRTLAASRYVLDPERRAALEEADLVERPYESTVSQGLVTRVGERGMLGLFAAALLATLGSLRWLSSLRPPA